MILRLNDHSRKFTVVVALLLSAWLSFYGIRAAVASYAAEADDPKLVELAARLEPGNPEYWYILARYQQHDLTQLDSSLARSSFQKAIALNPGATNAWLDLGTLEEAEGNTAEARAAYLQAKKTYPTSATVFWRYGNFLLRQGQRPQAYAELRQAVAADPHLATLAFTNVYRTNPNIDEILAQVLPAKQSVYVDVVIELAHEKQLGDAKTVWARLITLHPRLAIYEVNPIVSALGIAGELSEARRIWNEGTATMNLPPLYARQDSVVWDPSFESGLSNVSFAWSFHSLEGGVYTEFDTREKLSGKQSLHLAFDGKHNPGGDVACALGAVTPGTQYLFSGWVKTKDVTGDQGVRFHLMSIGNTQIPVAATREIHGTTSWASIEQDWTAGLGIREVEVCVSREPSTNPDIRISGDAWIDDVTLVPKAAERPATTQLTDRKHY